jgi:hypothetical protein
LINDWIRRRKIATLPGVRLTPQVVLARTLEKAAAGTIVGVYIGIEFKDGSFDADWSQMKCSALATHALVAQHLAIRELAPNDDIKSAPGAG